MGLYGNRLNKKSREISETSEFTHEQPENFEQQDIVLKTIRALDGSFVYPSITDRAPQAPKLSGKDAWFSSSHQKERMPRFWYPRDLRGCYQEVPHG